MEEVIDKLSIDDVKLLAMVELDAGPAAHKVVKSWTTIEARI